MIKRLNGKRLLVVEDDEALKISVAKLFGLSGAEVEMAGDIQEAFQLLSEKKFDIVFSDVRMPGGSGLDLARKVRDELSYPLHFYLCTGYSDLDEANARKDGVAIFSKPFNFQEVVLSMAGQNGVAGKD